MKAETVIPKLVTIIAGSRDCDDYEILLEAIENMPWEISEVISGNARGADKMGERWAEENHIPLMLCPANWDKYGKSAGYRRNCDMAEKATALLAIWDGESKGTKHMIDIANKQGLEVFIWKILNPLDIYIKEQ